MRILIALSLFAGVAAYAQTGEVVLTGTIIQGGGAPATGYEAAKAFDGNFLTSFSSTAPGTWVGIDAGQATTVIRVMVAPRAGDASNPYAYSFIGTNDTIQASNSATFASGNNTLYTVPSWATGLPGLYPGVLTEVPVSPGGTYRYYRWNDSTSYGMLAEIRFYVTAAAGLTAMPAPPIITPGSGAILSGSTTVSMTSRTTSAVMHYSTDGTTPTCSSTTYSGPFTLTISSTVHLQAVACDASTSVQSSEVAGQYYKNYTWNAGDLEYDDKGNLVEAHAGHILFAEGKWWRLGINAAFPGANTQLWLANPGWWMYSSTDLTSWHNEGQVVPAPAGAHSERATIVYNAAYSNYVLWGDCGPNYSSLGACIFTAPHPRGPWTLVSSNYSPGSLGFKDNALFVDDDGTGYAVFTDGGQDAMYIMQLAADYLSAVGSATTVSSGLSGSNVREAPAMFKRNGVYFIITSSSVYLVPTTGAVDVQYQTASSPLGRWSALPGPGTFYTQAPSNGNPYNGQPTQVVQMGTGYLYIADNWVGNTVSNAGSSWTDFTASTTVYLPLVFPTNTTVHALSGTDAPVNWNPSYFNPCSGTTPLNIHPSLLINDCIPGRWNPTAYPGGGTNGALKELSDEAMAGTNTDFGPIVANWPRPWGTGTYAQMITSSPYSQSVYELTDAPDSLTCTSGGGTATAFCTQTTGLPAGPWFPASADFQANNGADRIQHAIEGGYVYQMYHRAGGHEAIANAYAAMVWSGLSSQSGPTYHIASIVTGPGSSACGTLASQVICITLSAPASPAITTGETVQPWGAPDDNISAGAGPATVIDSTHLTFGVESSVVANQTYSGSTMVLATTLWNGIDGNGISGAMFTSWLYFYNWDYDWIVANGLQAYVLGQLEAGWWCNNISRQSSQWSTNIIESEFHNHGAWVNAAEMEAGPVLYNDDPNIGALAWALSQGLLYQGVAVQPLSYVPQTYQFNLSQSYAKISQSLSWEGIGYLRYGAVNFVRAIDAVETATGRNNAIWSTYFPNAWTAAMYEIYTLRPDGFSTPFGDTVWYASPSGSDYMMAVMLNAVHPDPHFVYFINNNGGNWGTGGSGNGLAIKSIYYPYVGGPGSHDYTDLPKARQFGADIVIRDWDTPNGISSTATQMTYTTGVHGTYHRMDDAGAFSLFKGNLLIGNGMDTITEPTYTNFSRTTWGQSTLTVIDPNDCYKQIGTTCGNVSDNGNEYVPNEGNQLMSERRRGPELGIPNVGAGLSGTTDRIWTGNIYNDSTLGPIYSKTDPVNDAILGTGSAYESISADLTRYYQSVYNGTGDNPNVKYSCTYDSNGLCNGGILDKIIHFHATLGTLDPVVRFMRVTSSNASFAKSLHFHTPSTNGVTTNAPIVNGNPVALGDNTVPNATVASATNMNSRVFIQPLLPTNPSVRVLGGNTCAPIPIVSCDSGNPTTCTTASPHGLQVNESVWLDFGTNFWADPDVNGNPIPVSGLSFNSNGFAWDYYFDVGHPGIGNGHYVTAVPDANHFTLNYPGIAGWSSTFTSGTGAPTNPAAGNPLIYYETDAAGGNTVWMSDTSNTWRQLYGSFQNYPAGLGLTAPTITSHASCNYTGHVDQQGPIGSGPANLWTDSMAGGTNHMGLSRMSQVDLQILPSSAATTDYFLNVVTPTSTGVSSAPTSTLISGTGYYGALITDSGGYYVPVFPTSTIPQTSLSYTATHSGTAQHVVTGLVAGSSFAVTQGGAQIATGTSDPSGAFAFTETGGGNFSLTGSGGPATPPQGSFPGVSMSGVGR